MKVFTRVFPLLILSVLIPGIVPAQTADEEVIVLSISGNKVDLLENLPETGTHLGTITAYYAEIPEISRQELAGLWQQMRRRTEDYRVAFRSGDTAEINETLDDLGYYWASIRTIHAREFTAAAISVIESAYAGMFPFIREPR
ncbi:MAG: hypothetical protein O2948_13040 [Proteobacteria bacterium]|nr:hypothetical protein [Pseudomonadota bacterium]